MGKNKVNNKIRLYMELAVMCCFLCVFRTDRVWERRNKSKILEKHRALLKREIKVNHQCNTMSHWITSGQQYFLQYQSSH